MAFTEKDLKKLGRAELLELLIETTEENQDLRARLREAEARLEDRRMIMDQCGNIAEASLQLNSVFQAAQAAAQEYLDNVKIYSETREEIFLRIEGEAKETARRMLDETRRKCLALEEETKKKCDDMTLYARKASEEYWNAVSLKIANSREAEHEEE